MGQELARRGLQHLVQPLRSQRAPQDCQDLAPRPPGCAHRGSLRAGQAQAGRSVRPAELGRAGDRLAHGVTHHRSTGGGEAGRRRREGQEDGPGEAAQDSVSHTGARVLLLEEEWDAPQHGGQTGR